MRVATARIFRFCLMPCDVMHNHLHWTRDLNGCTIYLEGWGGQSESQNREAVVFRSTSRQHRRSLFMTVIARHDGVR
jgi:hypothetical protein